MGEIINVRCKACKKEWQCFTGNGLLHGKKESVLAAFLEKERHQAECLLAASAIPAYDFQYRLAICGHCHNVVAVPVLRTVESDEACVGSCPLCGKRTKNLCAEGLRAEEWSEKTACPVCMRKALLAETGGHWD